MSAACLLSWLWPTRVTPPPRRRASSVCEPGSGSHSITRPPAGRSTVLRPEWFPYPTTRQRTSSWRSSPARRIAGAAARPRAPDLPRRDAVGRLAEARGRPYQRHHRQHCPGARTASRPRRHEDRGYRRGLVRPASGLAPQQPLNPMGGCRDCLSTWVALPAGTPSAPRPPGSVSSRAATTAKEWMTALTGDRRPERRGCRRRTGWSASLLYVRGPGRARRPDPVRPPGF
jgi:hypothetical protein